MLTFRDWSALAVMAAGQIGRMAEDIVEGRIGVEGRMRDALALMQALPTVLAPITRIRKEELA